MNAVLGKGSATAAGQLNLTRFICASSPTAAAQDRSSVTARSSSAATPLSSNACRIRRRRV